MDWKATLEKQIRILEELNDRLRESNAALAGQEIRLNALAIKELVQTFN